MGHMQGDAGIGNPRRTGVTQAVTDEIAEPEGLREVVPAGRIADGRGDEDSEAVTLTSGTPYLFAVPDFFVTFGAVAAS